MPATSVPVQLRDPRGELRRGAPHEGCWRDFASTRRACSVAAAERQDGMTNVSHVNEGEHSPVMHVRPGQQIWASPPHGSQPPPTQ